MASISRDMGQPARRERLRPRIAVWPEGVGQRFRAVYGTRLPFCLCAPSIRQGTFVKHFYDIPPAESESE